LKILKKSLKKIVSKPLFSIKRPTLPKQFKSHRNKTPGIKKHIQGNKATKKPGAGKRNEPAPAELLHPAGAPAEQEADAKRTAYKCDERSKAYVNGNNTY
jgi:hypothetical protein